MQSSAQTPIGARIFESSTLNNPLQMIETAMYVICTEHLLEKSFVIFEDYISLKP